MSADEDAIKNKVEPQQHGISLKLLAVTLVIALLSGFAGGMMGGALWKGSLPSGSSSHPVNTSGPAPEVTPVADVVHPASDVPPVITRNTTATVNVYLRAVEENGQVEPGASYTYWTYNGTVPGPFLRVLVNDAVVVHFTNDASSKMTHSIDFHAATGPGGGATLDSAAPGQSVSFTFKALVPGLFVYHCGTPDVSMHIANGMFGMILVQPSVPLPPVDKEFYVMQSELYTKWAIHAQGNQLFDMSRLLNATPTYFVFNGAYKALTGMDALRASVNQTVRIYFGDAGPNFISSFHVIGETMERVWQYGDLTDPPLHGAQTVPLTPGGSVVADLHLLYPGNYTMVDHAITRAVDLGAVGILNVTGWKNGTIIHANTPRISPSVARSGNETITLYGSMSGWGYGPGNISNPGPTLDLKPGEGVTLRLYSQDGVTHNWFMDPSGANSPSPGDPVSPDFSSPTVPLIYTFSVPGTQGGWTYRCAYHPGMMYGMVNVGTSSGGQAATPHSMMAYSAYLAVGVALALILVVVLIVVATRRKGAARTPKVRIDSGKGG